MNDTGVCHALDVTTFPMSQMENLCFQKNNVFDIYKRMVCIFIKGIIFSIFLCCVELTVLITKFQITKNTMPTSDPHAYEKRVSISDLNTMLGTEVGVMSVCESIMM